MEGTVPFRDTQLTPQPDVNLSPRDNVKSWCGEDAEPAQRVTFAPILNPEPK